MKALHLIFLFLLVTTPLYAEQALVLTEIERIQEKIWYLQKDLVEQKAAINDQKQQISLLASSTEQGQNELKEQLASQLIVVAGQRAQTDQALGEMASLTASLAALSEQFASQNKANLEQAKTISALQGALQQLQAEVSSEQAKTARALAATQAHSEQTRLKIDALDQDVGGRVEQISLWGIGAALVLAVMLTFIIVSRRDRKR